MVENIVKLFKTIDYQFNNLSILEQALRHSSSVNDKILCNERLEFLGDSILGLCITEHLYQLLPNKREGELTAIKSTVVAKESLACVARDLNLDCFIELGKGMINRKTISDAVLADAFEALIAAIYLDSNLSQVREFLLKVLAGKIEREISNIGEKNFKSHLQEYLQKNKRKIPAYKVINESGPDHDKVFIVGVFINNKEYEKGEGNTKKEAEQLAAKRTLAKIKKDYNYLK